MKNNRLDHIAIVVRNLKKQTEWFRKIYNAKKLGGIYNYKEQKVKIQFLQSENLKIELLEPLGVNSPIRNFLKKNELSKYYHIAFNVKNFKKVERFIKKNNGKIISRSKNGWRGNEVMFALFFHKKDYQLIEYVKKK